jgi:hypothetical protein
VTLRSSGVAALAAVAVLVAGCGGGSSDSKGGKPEDAVSSFYLAVLGDAHYFDRACSFASPRFHLREVQGAAKPPSGELCPGLAEYVHGEYEHRYTAADFWVDKVNVKGQTADAETSLGKAGLERVGGQWRVLWVEAPTPPAVPTPPAPPGG